MAIKAGLDFGTTTSILSYMEAGELKDFTYGGKTDLGTPYIPSLVAYGKDFIRIGQYARALPGTSLHKYFKMLLPEDDWRNWSEQYGPYLRDERTPTEVAGDYIGELITGRSPYRKTSGIEPANPASFCQFTGKEI